DVLLGLRLDLRQLAQAVLLRGRFELVDRGDAELLVDRPGGRRPDARNPQQRDEPRGHGGLELGVALRLAGGDELRDRLGDRWPGLRDLGQAALLEEEGHRFAKVAYRTRDLAVGDGAEDVLALQLEQIADLV